jgi:hypothetical protein
MKDILPTWSSNNPVVNEHYLYLNVELEALSSNDKDCDKCYFNFNTCPAINCDGVYYKYIRTII